MRPTPASIKVPSRRARRLRSQPYPVNRVPARRSRLFSSLERGIATYLRVESKRLLARTVTVKKADLDLFQGFFTNQGHRDALARWTAEVSESFRQFLRKRRPGSYPRPEKFFSLATRPRHLDYSPATINRILSTVRHFAKWLDECGSFPEFWSDEERELRISRQPW